MQFICKDKTKVLIEFNNIILCYVHNKKKMVIQHYNEG